MSESGLKQRKVVASNFTQNSNDNTSDNELKEDSDEYDADSKETRLTLMEEILLLGLKDKEVNDTQL